MIDCCLPVKVKIAFSSIEKPKDGLLYAIHYHEDGPLATCWMLHSQTWITCQLAFVTPVLEELDSQATVTSKKRILEVNGDNK